MIKAEKCGYKVIYQKGTHVYKNTMWKLECRHIRANTFNRYYYNIITQYRLKKTKMTGHIENIFDKIEHRQNFMSGYECEEIQENTKETKKYITNWFTEKYKNNKITIKYENEFSLKVKKEYTKITTNIYTLDEKQINIEDIPMGSYFRLLFNVCKTYCNIVNYKVYVNHP